MIDMPPSATPTLPTQNSAQVQQLGSQYTPPSVKGLTLRILIEAELARTRQQQITTGAIVTNEKSGEKPVSINADRAFYAASLNKLPVALLVEEDLRSGKLGMDQQLTWSDSDVRAGNGTFDQAGAAKSAKLKDVLFDMLNPSGNTAVRVLVNQALGGPQAVNDRLAAKPELKVTRLDVLTPTSFYLGNTTGGETLGVMRKLLATNDQYQQFIRNAMATNIFTNFGTRSQLTDKSGVTLVNKVGILDDVPNNVRHDVGFIYNNKTGTSYAYAFLTETPSANNSNGSANEETSLQVLGSNALRYAGDTSQGGPGKAIKRQVDLYTQKTLY